MNHHQALTPLERIRNAYATFAGQVILTTSGGETSAAMPHLVASALGNQDFPLVFVDHGFYTSATYRMIEYFREAGYRLKIYRSELTPGEIEREYSGWCDPRSPLFSTVVRKIKHAPLNRAFAELQPKAWIRGIMRHETPERQAAELVQHKNGIYQVHPILDWSRDTMLAYLTEYDLPINQDHWDPTKGRDQRGECLIGDHCGVRPSAHTPITAPIAATSIRSSINAGGARVPSNAEHPTSATEIHKS
jgi:phosphoadenosine phosphosulfate reductase